MSFVHRRLLFLSSDERTRVVLEKKYECNHCLFSPDCPDKCKNDSDDAAHGVFPPPPLGQSPKDSHMPTILILMLCILGAAFVFLCYLTILRRYRSNLSSRRRDTVLDDNREDLIDENHGPMMIHPIWYINTVGLQQSVIDSIAVFKYKKGDGLVEGTDCSVCLSEFEEDESLRLLPKCSHAFHINCIDTWLRSHKNCPLCRAPIVRDTIPEADESVVYNSGSLESTSADDQVERNEVSDDTIGAENTGHSPNEETKNPNSISVNNRIRVLSDLSDHRVRVDEEFQPVRRSISMDAASASMVYATVAKIHPVQEEGSSEVEDLEQKKQISFKDETKPGDTKLIIHKSRKSFSFGRSLQKMPIRMKRSFSSSSKSSMPRHSRSQEII